jgi:hypothetical protein
MLLSFLIAACGGGSNGGEDGLSSVARDILIEFDYAANDIQALHIVGYRVYANDMRICESSAPYQMFIDASDCDQRSLSSLQRPFTISMTAISSNNGAEQESARSAGYQVN